ncbi:predicted protein [Nematostella vectensis]|uniref:Uncharacterized protein n=1 Tax=Nematostella vectensis TaxID=45351 RepID=A7RNP8_NEMVE|nr:predicted protein [Nematostella vectensis]|eukprot:XP_001638955.1 predicted protein [Nematostella vectensis]
MAQISFASSECRIIIIDVDECASGHHYCYWKSSTCVNTEPGYYCKCKPGYYPAPPPHNGNLTCFAGTKAKRQSDFVCKLGIRTKKDSLTYFGMLEWEITKRNLGKEVIERNRGTKCPPLRPVDANGYFKESHCSSTGGRYDEWPVGYCTRACRGGYRLEGAQYTRCQSSGKWLNSQSGLTKCLRK